MNAVNSNNTEDDIKKDDDVDHNAIGDECTSLG